jgi:peptidoglycan hydrolase-like protein with peptidoglycan-binding domain
MAAGIGPSTTSSTATLEKTLPIDNQPASFRYNNPGAQFPAKEAAKFGQLGFGRIDHNQFLIALFPNPVNGAASNFDLLNRNFTGMSIGDAGVKWTGAHGFGVPGFDPSVILTRDMLSNKAQAIALLKAIAGRESGRGNNLSEEQWRQAHDMFLAGSADAYLATVPGDVPANPVAGTPSGAGLLKRAREHLHEQYEHVLVPKDDPNWKGPWDCSEFISWLVFQEAHILYGCEDDHAPPATAKAFTGDWKTDVARLGKRVSVDEAASTVGGILLRFPPGPGQMGHIVLCDGRGGTVEAKGKAFGVVADTVHHRSWDTGVLIPGIEYSSNGQLAVTLPADPIYQLNGRGMDKGVTVRIQTALLAAGFNPGLVNGEFNLDTQNAVLQFQDDRGLTVDGQVGPETAGSLGISLKPDVGGVQVSDPIKSGAGANGKDVTPLDLNLMPLILALLSKEKQMPTDPAKPGQTIDPTNVILLLLLQSLQSGKQPDLTQLLTAVVNGHAQGTGTQPGSDKPAPPSTSNQGSQPQPPQTINDLIALLLPFVFQKITGQPLPGAPAASTQSTGDSGSVMTKPSVQIGAAGLGLASLLQAFHFIAPPFNFAPADGTSHPDPILGTLATVIPLVVAGIGATGGWGSLIGIGSSLLQGIASAAANGKTKAPA